MRNNLKKSFQFRMVCYTVLSLILALLTEILVLAALFSVRKLTMVQPQNQLTQQGSMKKQKKPDSVYENAVSENSRIEGNYERFWRRAAKIRKSTMIGFFVFMLVMGIVFFCFYFMLFTRSYAKYLVYIKEKILSLSQGNFEDRLEVKGEDEIAVIADQINNMAKELAVLMEMERGLEKQKNELITSVAHDLRTPLTSVIGYLDLIRKKEGLSEEEREKYIQIGYEKSLRLQKLIEDLFHFTKLDSGEIELHKMQLDMVRLVEQMVDEFYPIFEDAGLTCEFDCSVKTAIVEADGELMARAIENLFSNAVRYGRDGKKIRVHIETKLGSVWVSVINYGILIPEENLEHIFERFYRVESSRNQYTGGTGLGLNIVQKIITLHEGKVFADSGTQGTRFRVVLPLSGAEN